MLYILPTAVFESLQRQKRDVIQKETNSRTPTMNSEELDVFAASVDNACKAVVHLSNVCKISQQYSINSEDLIDLDKSIEAWQEFLKNSLQPNVFTINMHYFNHIVEAIRHLGPLRLVSARPMERMIGKMKSSIHSRKEPAKNANTSVNNHFANVYKQKYTTATVLDDNIVLKERVTIPNCIQLVENATPVLKLIWRSYKHFLKVERVLL